MRNIFFFILFFVAGAVVATALIGVVSYASAQTQGPFGSYSGGMMGGWRGTQSTNRGGGFGMMGQRWGRQGGYAPMHEYMEAAFANALGIDKDELETELAAGKTMWQVAADKGLTAQEISAKMTAAAKEAVTQMVTDKVITQQQADLMVERMTQMAQNGSFGAGSCHGGLGRGFQTPEAPSTQP